MLAVLSHELCAISFVGILILSFIFKQQEVEEMVSRNLGWEIVRLLSWEDQTGSRVQLSCISSRYDIALTWPPSGHVRRQW